MPPEVVGQVLRPAIPLPRPLNLEGLVVEHEDPAGPVAARRAERVEVDPLGPAVHGVQRLVPGLARYLVALDHLHQPGIARIRLGVEHVDARGARARHDQVAPLHVRVRGVGAEVRAAGVPAEVVQFVVAVGQLRLPDDAAVRRGLWVGVHHADGVLAAVLAHVEQRHIGELLGRRLHRQGGRGIEGRIGSPLCHESTPVKVVDEVLLPVYCARTPRDRTRTRNDDVVPRSGTGAQPGLTSPPPPQQVLVRASRGEIGQLDADGRCRSGGEPAW